MRISFRAAVGSGVLAAAVAVALRRMVLPVGRYVVEGPSMLPTYRPGERVLVNRAAYWFSPPAEGDAVVLRDPERGEHLLLKRIAAVDRSVHECGARYYVLGDNRAESRDSRSFGDVPRDAIVGKVWLTY